MVSYGCWVTGKDKPPPLEWFQEDFQKKRDITGLYGERKWNNVQTLQKSLGGVSGLEGGSQ